MDLLVSWRVIHSVCVCVFCKGNAEELLVETAHQ